MKAAYSLGALAVVVRCKPDPRDFAIIWHKFIQLEHIFLLGDAWPHPSTAMLFRAHPHLIDLNMQPQARPHEKELKEKNLTQ